MMDERGQASIEALISLAAILAFISLLLLSVSSVQKKAPGFGDSLSARVCASSAAELAGYYRLDGKGTHFPLRFVASEAGGKAYCIRGESNASSAIPKIEADREPV